LIIDTHCHVIVAEMTAGTVPEHWRPVVADRDPASGWEAGDRCPAILTC
jgi:hypothetical protein